MLNKKKKRDKTFRWLTAANMVKPVWKNQSSDFKLVDFYTSGVLDLVESLVGLGFGALKLELGIPQFFRIF